MSIKIVVYNETYSKVEEEIPGFNSASEAADWRDHCDRLTYKNTKLEQEEKPTSIRYGIPMEADGNEDTELDQPQRIQYYSEAEENNITARQLMVVLVVFIVVMLFTCLPLSGVISALLYGIPLG